jgi:hypothetical protein
MAEPPGAVPFDQYSRYRACATLLASLLREGETVLDAGSGESCLLASFLPGARTTFLDPLLPPGGEEEGDRIAGDVRSPALDGRRFDYVACVDVLEHVPPAERDKFLSRLSSLAGKGIVLSFPAREGGEAERTDRWIGAAYEAAAGGPYGWLSEHGTNGLPGAGETEALLASLGWRCRSWGHGHAPLLRELLPFFLASLETEALRPSVDALSRHFNARLYRGEFEPPTYRRILLATREEAPEGIGPASPGRGAADDLEEERRRLWAIAASVPAAAKGLERRARELEAELAEARGELRIVKESRSWKVTAPLRRLLAAWRDLRGGGGGGS